MRIMARPADGVMEVVFRDFANSESSNITAPIPEMPVIICSKLSPEIFFTAADITKRAREISINAAPNAANELDDFNPNFILENEIITPSIILIIASMPIRPPINLPVSIDAIKYKEPANIANAMAISFICLALISIIPHSRIESETAFKAVLIVPAILLGREPKFLRRSKTVTLMACAPPRAAISFKIFSKFKFLSTIGEKVFFKFVPSSTSFSPRVSAKDLILLNIASTGFAFATKSISFPTSSPKPEITPSFVLRKYLWLVSHSPKLAAASNKLLDKGFKCSRIVPKPLATSTITSFMMANTVNIP